MSQKMGKTQGERHWGGRRNPKQTLNLNRR